MKKIFLSLAVIAFVSTPVFAESQRGGDNANVKTSKVKQLKKTKKRSRFFASTFRGGSYLPSTKYVGVVGPKTFSGPR